MNPSFAITFRMPAHVGVGYGQVWVTNHGVVSLWSKVDSREPIVRPDDHVIG